MIYLFIYRVWKVRDELDKLFALKIIPREISNALIKREILIHRHMTHPNIVKLLEYFNDSQYYYLILELAEIGELFDSIEPDLGFQELIAHFYFRQLLNALDYIHNTHSIVHRDLKPENLLLDKFGNLKIADFGTATLFKKSGENRMLTSKCGTTMYMAPEVFSGPYDGLKAELWSAGIVLFVMLTGCHPWSDTTSHQFKLFQFKRKEWEMKMKNTKSIKGSEEVEEMKMEQESFLPSPWNRISKNCLDLLFGILKEDPKERFDPKEILAHPWISKSNILFNSNLQCSNSELLFSLIRQNNNFSLEQMQEERRKWQKENANEDMEKDLNLPSHEENFNVFSQPEFYKLMSWNTNDSNSERPFSFSQPSETMTLSSFSIPPSPSQSSTFTFSSISNPSPSSILHPLSILPLSSSSRLYSRKSKEFLIDEIENILEELLIPFRSFNVVTFKLSFFTIDRSKIPLNGEISLITLNDEECIIFQKKRGNTLEFKKLCKFLLERIRKSEKINQEIERNQEKNNIKIKPLNGEIITTVSLSHSSLFPFDNLNDR